MHHPALNLPLQKKDLYHLSLQALHHIDEVLQHKSEHSEFNTGKEEYSTLFSCYYLK